MGEFSLGFSTVFSVNSQLDEPCAKRAGVKTQNSRGSVRSFYHPCAIFEDAANILPLHLFARPRSRSRLLCWFHQKIFCNSQRWSFRINDCAFDDVDQFSNVSPPRIIVQTLQSRWRNGSNDLP